MLCDIDCGMPTISQMHLNPTTLPKFEEVEYKFWLININMQILT